MFIRIHQTLVCLANIQRRSATAKMWDEIFGVKI